MCAHAHVREHNVRAAVPAAHAASALAVNSTSFLPGPPGPSMLREKPRAWMRGRFWLLVPWNRRNSLGPVPSARAMARSRDWKRAHRPGFSTRVTPSIVHAHVVAKAASTRPYSGSVLVRSTRR